MAEKPPTRSTELPPPRCSECLYRAPYHSPRCSLAPKPRPKPRPRIAIPFPVFVMGTLVLFVVAGVILWYLARG